MDVGQATQQLAEFLRDSAVGGHHFGSTISQYAIDSAVTMGGSRNLK